jgi:hypothetical protein
MISKHGTFYSVLPQEERGLTKLKVNMATGELYRPTTEEENEQFVKEFMTAGMEHQAEHARTKRRHEKIIAEATGEELEEEE